MANRWGIPKNIEEIVLQRDIKCVYCKIEFSNDSRKTKQTWEHIINDIRINNSDNIALCCCSCNASKGNKILENWLESNYCKNKQISKETVAPIVKKYLKQNKNSKPNP